MANVIKPSVHRDPHSTSRRSHSLLYVRLLELEAMQPFGIRLGRGEVSLLHSRLNVVPKPWPVRVTVEVVPAVVVSVQDIGAAQCGSVCRGVVPCEVHQQQPTVEVGLTTARAAPAIRRRPPRRCGALPPIPAKSCRSPASPEGLIQPHECLEWGERRFAMCIAAEWHMHVLHSDALRHRNA